LQQIKDKELQTYRAICSLACFVLWTCTIAVACFYVPSTNKWWWNGKALANHV